MGIVQDLHLASLARGLKAMQAVVQEIFWEYPGHLSYYDLPRQLRVQRVVDHWPQIDWMFRKNRIGQEDLHALLKDVAGELNEVIFKNEIVEHVLRELIKEYGYGQV